MHNNNLFRVAAAVILLSVCISGFSAAAQSASSNDLINQYIKQLRDNRGDSGFDAGRNLARIADPAATDALITVLQTDKDSWIRTRAAQVLRDRGDKRAVDALIAALKDKDQGVRQWVAEALGVFKDPRSIPALISVLADDDHHSGAQRVTSALASFGSVAIEPLLVALKDDDPKVRLGAVSAIRIIIYREKDQRVFEPLLVALNDTNEDVRVEAAWALGDIKDARAIDPLIAMTKRSDRSQSSAVDALGMIGNAKAVPILCDLLNDESDWIVKSAAEALGRIGDPKAADALYALRANTNRELRAAAGIALTRLGDSRAAPILVGVLDNGEEVQSALKRLGGAAIETLGAALKDINQFRVRNVEQGIELEESDEERQSSDRTHRFWIVEILADSTDPRAEDALIAALSTSDAETKSSVVYALRKFRDDRCVNALISMLGDRNAGVRNAAIGSLKEINDPRGTEAVLTLAAKNPQSLTDSVVGFLAGIDDPRVTGLVLPMLKDKDAKVRMRGVSICKKLKDKRMAKQLVPLMSDSNASIREVTASTLGTLRDPIAVPSLIAALKDRKPTVRQYSATALAEIKDSRAIKPLITTLRDPNPDVRATAAEALGEFKDPSAIEPLILLLKENDWDRRMALYASFCASLEGHGLEMDKVRENAATALGKIGKPAVAALIACLKDPDPMTKQLALGALGEIGDPQAIDPIASLLTAKYISEEKYPEAEKAWKKVMAGISKQEKDPRVVKRINEIRKEMDQRNAAEGGGGIQLAVAQSLGKIKDPRAVTLLLQLTRDKSPFVRAQVIESLAVQNDPRALDVFASALKDSDERVRQAAGYALMESTDPKAVDILIELAKSKTADSQQYVIQGLSKHKTSQATEAIAALLSDASEFDSHHGEATRVNEAAAIALAERNDSRGLALLLEMLRDQNPDSYYRTLAARTISKLTSVNDPDILLRARADMNPAVKMMALALLSRIGRPEGSEALSLVKAALNPTASEKAARENDEEEGIGDLDQAEIAVYSLSMLDNPEVVDLLLGALECPNTSVRAAASAVLGDRKEKRAVEPLIDMLSALGDNWYAVSCVAEALGKIGDPRAIAPLMSLLDKDMDPEFHETIATALTTLTGQNFGTDVRRWRSWWASQGK